MSMNKTRKRSIEKSKRDLEIHALKTLVNQNPNFFEEIANAITHAIESVSKALPIIVNKINDEVNYAIDVLEKEKTEHEKTQTDI